MSQFRANNINRRHNMTEELNLIENERLLNLNKNRNNSRNKKRTEQQAMRERKEKYLKEFNSILNEEIHEQDWFGPEMEEFHKKMGLLNNNKCENCQEM